LAAAAGQAEAVAELSLIGALLAAVCFGTASVFQARGSRAAPTATGLDLRLLTRLLRSWPFLLGLGLDGLGFVFELAALRTLPLFLVQSCVAASLAVTAVVAAQVLGERLRTREWLAVGAVCLGLAGLGVSAGREGSSDPGGRFDVALATGLVILGGLAALAGRWGEPMRSIALGVAAGLAFGVVALAARTITDWHPLGLLTEPSLYLLAAGGGLGFLFFATALQRGSVAVPTAAMVLGETVVPAAVGTLVLGDAARPGLVWLAIVGFALALGGALALSRFGEVEEHPAPA
jgi:drug/metabolite transporter (DMT)-like permease